MAQCPARAVHWCSWSWCLHQWKFRSWFALFGSRRLLDDEKNTKWTRWIVCLRNSFALRLIEIILGLRLCRISRSLSTRILETRTATRRDNFSCQDRIVSQIFILLISNGEKILGNANELLWGQATEVKIAHFRLPSAPQKWSCLSSLKKSGNLHLGELSLMVPLLLL